MKIKKVLITGVTGQDGIFLSTLLLEKGYKVYGVSRNPSRESFLKNIYYLNKNVNVKNFKFLKSDLSNENETKKLIKEIEPETIFNLVGPSSVYESFHNKDIKKEIIIIFNNLTSACINNLCFPSFFQASSSEMFGLNTSYILDENSDFIPNSPYAEAKLINHLTVKTLREKYNWDIVSGILFNHESEFRDSGYLISKIIDYLILDDSSKPLVIGSLNYQRDWSYAGDIMKLVKLISEKTSYNDFIVGSGISTSIEYLLDISFSFFNKDYKKYIEINTELLRKNDPEIRIANISKLQSFINVSEFKTIDTIIEKIIKFKLNQNL